MPEIINDGDSCPYCNRLTMPQWSPDPRSAETGRMCPVCNYIEPKPKAYEITKSSDRNQTSKPGVIS